MQGLFVLLIISLMGVVVMLSRKRRNRDRSKLNSADFYRYNCPSTVMTSAHHGLNSSRSATQQFETIDKIMSKYGVQDIPESFYTKSEEVK